LATFFATFFTDFFTVFLAGLAFFAIAIWNPPCWLTLTRIMLGNLGAVNIKKQNLGIIYSTIRRHYL
jgi:hypothetical protein